MEEDKFFIDEMNPLFKFLILIIVTIIGSLDFMPFVSSTLIISGLVLASLFSSMSIKSILSSVKAFIAMSIGFMTIILLVRFFSNESLQLLNVLGLGFRIILISVYTTIFVKTTNPVEFVMVLIEYFKVPDKFGYAFLTAYRFLPTFKDELEIIKYAHQVRGISESRNPLVRVWSSQRYILPMLANAVRKGIRISMAMETRAFGKYDTRTYYRELTISKKEIFVSSVYILYIIIILLLFHFNGLTSFSINYV